jgi:hypothetical protein
MGNNIFGNALRNVRPRIIQARVILPSLLRIWEEIAIIGEVIGNIAWSPQYFCYVTSMGMFLVTVGFTFLKTWIDYC